jgi:hypothetical protein
LTEQKPEESFKVVDRRLFNEGGELRKDVAEQTEREQAAADAVAAKAAKSAQGSAPAGGAQKSATAGQGGGEAQGNSGAQPNAADSRKPSHGFQMLVDFMARNAAMVLGGYTDPRTNQPLIDLDGAREIIEMLDALRETTRGNLAAEDDRLLTEVVGSLKLSYVEISKAAEKAMLEKAKARP